MHLVEWPRAKALAMDALSRGPFSTCAGGGMDNVREFPEQQTGVRSWECLQQQTSYPGVEAIVKVNGKDVKKRLPSLSPATARDARMTSTWQVSEATVQKIVNAAEAAAQRQEREAAAGPGWERRGRGGGTS